MLADYTLEIATPSDAYAFKHAVYSYLDRIEPVKGRTFLYSRCPITKKVIVRSDNDKLIKSSSEMNIIPQPQTEREYDFCLRASPMHQTLNGKKPADPETWITNQASRMGVDIIVCHHHADRVWCSKKTRNDISGFYVPDVVYVGRFRVTDAVKLDDAIRNGIGRHRAFGFGLLQLYED